MSSLNKPTEFDDKKGILKNHLIPAFGKRQLDQIDERAIDAYTVDAHKETIVASILHPTRDKPVLVEFANTEQEIKRFVRNVHKKTTSPLRACYEAGPLGFGLLRQLETLDVDACVIAPSKIPSMPGDRVKTTAKKTASKKTTS